MVSPADLTLSIIPLGGLGEIGLNMMAVRYGEDVIVIDAGLMFPDEEMLGVDIVVPDLTYLKQVRENIRAVILTHGHEDHIGALPYLLKDIPVPVYGTKLTLGLAENRLREHGVLTSADLRCITSRQKVQIGKMDVEFIRVCHSVVDGVALAITTPVGVVIHSGDFKIDQTPLDGEEGFDFYKFAEYGEKGVHCLLSDSTNVKREGFTLSERDISKTLRNIFRDAGSKVIAACFASNIHRIQQIVDCSAEFGRKLCLAGRSMLENCRIAQDLGYLKIPDNLLIGIRDLDQYPPNRITILSTGSQGEPMSALARIAINDHPHIKAERGDTVMISARVIPGNEKSIARLINHFFRRGANVLYEEISDIHTSGHASREELKMMINLVRPRFFIPIHGEYHHLVYHCQLAKNAGINPDNIILAEDGDRVDLTPSTAQISGRVPAGRIFVDGKGVGDVGEVVLRDRQHLSTDGMVVSIVGINLQSGTIISGPEIISRGFVYEDESKKLLDEAKEKVVELLEDMGPELKTEPAQIKDHIRSVLRKFFYKKMARKPMILPIIMEI